MSATATGPLGSARASLAVTVSAGASDAPGLYVSPSGSDAAPGTAAAPLRTVKRATQLASPGVTIYLRGGVYTNDEYGQPWGTRTASSLARITASGTEAAWITLRPHGNEYPKLISDVNGLAFANARYWIVEGLELEGTAKTLDYATAMSLWWAEDNNQISGRGISNNSCEHMVFRRCVIHDFPGAGIGNNEADWVTSQDNVIYGNGRWTTAGTHGIANSSLATSDPATADQEKVVMEGNLVFGNESVIISHVFSKGEVTLVVDEGNGLHLQNNARTFFGLARVENNVVLFNGKGGLGLNTIDGVTIRNNAFFRNARVVDTGELILQTSTAASVVGNLFEPRPDRPIIKDSDNAYVNVGANAATAGVGSATLPAAVLTLPAVFAAPTALNFSPAVGVPVGMGVPASRLAAMRATVEEFGILVQEPTTAVDAPYMEAMKATIFATWPPSRSELVLHDKKAGRSYTYAQRCHFPGPPTTAPCP
ncbi:MAG TPA: right-handed parallel beta-helix repeat-containing protein [Polyangiaceae bacterium]|nr:right-handed parallel beta-helix repeat-containing protein [Polyangiaceae bacterium]